MDLCIVDKFIVHGIISVIQLKISPGSTKCTLFFNIVEIA